MASVHERIKAVQATRDQQQLIAALADASPLVVEAAAKRISDPDAAAALLAAYQRLHAAAPKGDSGCWARMALIEALARCDVPEGETAAWLAIRTVQVEFLNNTVMDTATGLRVAAAGLLGARRAQGALIELAVLLHDFQPNTACASQDEPFAKLATRVAAARAIGALGDPGGAAVLAVKLAYSDGEVAEVLGECMDALAALREPRIIDLLKPWLANTNSFLVGVAATALAKGGGAAAVPVLEAAVATVTGETRTAIVYALAGIRASETRDALRRLAQHSDKAVRSAAREFLPKE